ncbi:hypothetical protein B0H19DRAFT_1086598 [Mycena capillaripes]|nr:hypothetical protein B0H19DRAFT_1086598 [Mycena capillaripes]
MSSGSRTLFGGSLKLLQDLSSGSNIPALEPLVNVAVRIYTAAEVSRARNNKKRANELAEDVGNSVKQILQPFWKKSVDDVWISRVLNQQHDAEELVESRARINEAKLEFLSFIQDIENLIPLRHPNLPFVGASALTAPRPFILMEPDGVPEKGNSNYRGCPLLSLKALQEGINHLRENEFALLHLKEQVSSIQYDGYKVILNIDLPRRKSRTEPGPIHCSSPIFPRTTVRAEDILGRLNNLDICRILEFAEEILDIHEVENHVLEVGNYSLGKYSQLTTLQGTFLPPSGQSGITAWVVNLRTGPGSHGKYAISRFRSRRNHEYSRTGKRVCPTKLDGLVVLGNILTELREKGIIDMNQFVSTEVDEDFGPTREGPWPKSIPAAAVFFQNGLVTMCGRRSQWYLRIWGYPNTEPSTLNAIRSGGIYFHALPDTIGAIEITERDQWGIWTTMLEFEGREEVVRLEPSQKFSYTHE